VILAVGELTVFNGSVILVGASGGAGEGKQHLTPNGLLKNVHQVKSDEALPFYCHPPNPCPKGYTSKCTSCCRIANNIFSDIIRIV